MNILRSATAALAAALILGACSGSPAETSPSDEVDTADLRVWFMDGSIPEDAQAWLVERFEEDHPGSTLTIEIQQWSGIVEKIQTAMASSSETPDVVEVGNTQSPTFTAIGAFSDITDMVDELGGDDLIESFIEVGSVDGSAFTLPLYAGSRIIYYRTDYFEQAGVDVPTSLDNFNEVASALTAANPPGVDGFKAMYLAAVEQHTLETWLFTHGGQYAVLEDGRWVGNLSSSESLAAVAQLQELFADDVLGADDSVAAATEPWVEFNAGNVAMFSGLTWAYPSIDQALRDEGKVGVFAMPGLEEGSIGRTFAGGSNIGISAASPNQALSRDVMRLVYSEEFQVALAEAGWVPGNTSYSAAQDAADNAELLAEVAANSQLTPAAQFWAVVEGEQVDQQFWRDVASGGDPAELAEAADARLEEILNQ